MMNIEKKELTKICKKHGELSHEFIHPKGKSKTGKQYYGCLLCKRETAKKYHKNNLENVKLSSAKYHQKRKLTQEFKDKKKKWMHDYQKRKRLLQTDKVRKKDREYKKLWSDRHREKINTDFKQMRDNLHPMYVKWYLKSYYGFDDPSDNLVHAKATIMLLKREIMKINVTQGKNKYVSKTRKYKRGTTSWNNEKIIIEGSTEDFITRKND